VFVCLSVRSHISKQRAQTSRNFLYILPMVVADDDGVCYVLPVFEDGVMFSHNAANVVTGR